MRMDKITARLQAALADAQSMAVGRDNTSVEPVHLLTALIKQRDGSVRPLLAKLDVRLPALERELEALLEKVPRLKNPTGEMQVSPELSRLLNLADRHAQQRNLD